MKKAMLIILLGCFMISLFALTTSSAIAQSADKVSRELEEPFFAVLEGIKTNPDQILISTAEGKVPWKRGYTVFYDFDKNEISAVKFVESYKNTGIGLWLDKNGIAAELRPVDM